MYSDKYKDLPGLIRKVQQNVPGAYNAFEKMIDAKLTCYVDSCVHDVVELKAIKKEDKRDIKQEVHFKLIGLFRGDGYEEQGNFFSLLYRITENCATDFYKHRHNMVYSAELLDIAEKTIADITEDEIETDEKEKERRIMMWAAGKLPPQQKTVFMLHIYDERDYEEISGLFEISEATVRSVFSKAQKKVINTIHRYLDEEKKKKEKELQASVRKMNAPVVIRGISALGK